MDTHESVSAGLSADLDAVATEYDSDVRAKIAQWDTAITEFLAVIDDPFLPPSGSAAGGEARGLVDGARTNLRIEARRFVWASKVGTLDAVGVHLVGANLKELVDLWRERRTCKRMRGAGRDRSPRALQRWRPSPPPELLRGTPAFDAALALNQSRADAQAELASLDKAMEGYRGMLRRVERIQTVRQLVSSLGAVGSFVALQVLVFSAVGIGLGAGAEALVSPLGWWGPMLGALLAAALVALVVRPALRARLANQLRSTTLDLLMKWMHLHRDVLLRQIEAVILRSQLTGMGGAPGARTGGGKSA